MRSVPRILVLATALGAIVGGGLSFAISADLFWGGLIGGALTGAALGTGCFLIASGTQDD